MGGLAICLLGGTLYLALSIVVGLVCGRGLAFANGTRSFDEPDLALAGDEMSGAGGAARGFS